MLLNSDKQFHICVNSEQVGKYVIMPGDPARVPLIASFLENAEHIATNREFNIYNGYLNNEKISVVSTGIGGPSAAIAMEELVKCGCHTFIRVGTSGGIAPKVIGGDLVLAMAAIRNDGTSKEYLPSDYPAVANFDVLTALEQSAKRLSQNVDGKRFHIGVVQSKDSFYGETNPETMPISEFLVDRWSAYVRLGCLASEMETATLFSVGLTRGVRVGAVLTAIWNIERPKLGLSNPIVNNSERAIQCAIDALSILIEQDRKNEYIS
jgi:uridine phosphorylase